MKNQFKKLSLVVIFVFAMMATALQGCGGPKTQEEHLAEMKEFAVPNGSASIYLGNDWEVQDMGLEGTGIDFWLGAASKSGGQIAMLLQFPKSGAVQLAADMEEVKATISENYSFSADGETYEAPAVPGMTNVEVAVGDVKVDTTTAKAYIVYGETDYANYAIMFAANKLGENEIAFAKAALSKFTETPVEEEDSTTAELTDTIRWFNASYAVLTELNGWDYNRFAGIAANDSSNQLEQESLKEWWDVSDRASADETLDWILTEGHRTGFADNMKTLQERGMDDTAEADRLAFVKDNFIVNDEEAQEMVDSYPLFAEYGETAIDGWDYCRALNLLSFYYLAGYYTEQEALDKSLEIAKTVQEKFGSWDELVDSYLRGYQYWAKESSDERRGIYEDLKSREDNPYAVDFKTPLEKTW